MSSDDRSERAPLIAFKITTSAQILAAIALVGAAFYWGGEMKAVTHSLADIAKDHEVRIRCIENHHGDCPR